MRRTVVFAITILAAAILSIWLCGCHKNRGAVYAFEPTPRAIIAQEGIAPSRSGRVGVDWVSSPTVHVLAVLGEGDHSRLGLLNSEDGGDTFDKPVWVSAVFLTRARRESQ